MNVIKIIFAFSLVVSLFADSTMNINVISQDAKKTNKITMIFFHMTYCPYCEKMLNETFEGFDSMANINENFYYVDMNIDDSGEIIYQNFKGSPEDFGDYFDIELYPTILFLENNKIIYYVHGYRNKEKFQHILNYVSSRSIDKMDLLEFIDNELMKD
jgi:thioredoxin-related protein